MTIYKHILITKLNKIENIERKKMQFTNYSINLANGFFGINFNSDKKKQAQLKAARDFAKAEGLAVGDILVAINRASYSKLK